MNDRTGRPRWFHRRTMGTGGRRSGVLVGRCQVGQKVLSSYAVGAILRRSRLLRLPRQWLFQPRRCSLSNGYGKP